MLQHIAQIDHVKPAQRRRADVVEKTFGDGRAQRTRMRCRLARRLDAMRQPAAPERGLQEEAGATTQIQQAAAIGQADPAVLPVPPAALRFLCARPGDVVLAARADRGDAFTFVVS